MQFLKKLSVKQKIILSVLILLLLGDCVLLAQRFISKTSFVTLSFPSEVGETRSKLLALNANAKSKSAKTGYFYFKFTDEQKKALDSYFENYGDASVCIKVTINDDEKKYDTNSFMYGLLFEDDFLPNGNLVDEIKKRPLARVDVNSFKEFEVAISIEKDEQNSKKTIPYGFFIYSEVPAVVVESSIRSAMVGWDIRGDIPIFAFAPNGGILDVFSQEVDFSGASLSFHTQNTKTFSMPKIIVSYEKPSNASTLQKPVTTQVNVGGENVLVYRTKNNKNTFDTYDIMSAALSNPFSIISAGDKNNKLNALLMVRNEVKNNLNSNSKIVTPFVTDPGLIIRWPRNKWRDADYEIFAWDRFPNVILFDTRNYDVQNDFFRRLAFFVEKMGYKGTLVKDDVLKNMHGYNAHDYSATSLAAFFTKASQENFTLNEKEYLLKDILLANGIIISDGNGYKAGRGAIISISKESEVWLRERLLAHEAWHGIYFIDEKFRNAVAAVYYTMDEKSRNFLLGYFESQPTLNYDVNDEYLMQNEFMAYMMQQKVSEVASYFVTRANWNSVRAFIPELSSHIVKTRGVAFEDASNILNEYAFDNWDLNCGRAWLIR